MPTNINHIERKEQISFCCSGIILVTGDGGVALILFDIALLNARIV